MLCVCVFFGVLKKTIEHNNTMAINLSGEESDLFNLNEDTEIYGVEPYSFEPELSESEDSIIEEENSNEEHEWRLYYIDWFNVCICNVVPTNGMGRGYDGIRLNIF